MLQDKELLTELRDDILVIALEMVSREGMKETTHSKHACVTTKT